MGKKRKFFVTLTAVGLLSSIFYQTSWQKPQPTTQNDTQTAPGDARAFSEYRAQGSSRVKQDSNTSIDLSDTNASFFSYQWALNNDGRLRRERLVSDYIPSDDYYPRLGSDGYRIGNPFRRGRAGFHTVTSSAVEGIDINIYQAWEVYKAAPQKRNVIVAVIDTGVDISHPDLAGSIWTNVDEIPGDGIDNDGNGYVDDVNGWNFYSGTNQVYTGHEDDHGTHAAGTIAAAWDGKGISGIADNTYVKIMPLKVLGSEDGVGDPESVRQAILYAEANGASICNLSLGAYSNDERLDSAIRDSKMLFIASAGNGDFWGRGFSTDQYPVYPAALPYDNVISVANLVFDGQLDESSNYGLASVDLAAPGSSILSTISKNSYSFMSGTSMAAPMVTGVAALVYSSRLDLDLAGTRNAIINSARKLSALEGKVATGGMLDAYGAITN